MVLIQIHVVCSAYCSIALRASIYIMPVIGISSTSELCPFTCSHYPWRFLATILLNQSYL